MHFANLSRFCDIKIDCKKILSTSLDAEFNALAEYITCIEKIDFENPEKSEKKIKFSISSRSSRCFRNCFQDENSLQKDIEYRVRVRISCSRG